MLLTETARINAIGYEGVSIDRFLECLAENNIEMVIDVRANPISRKPGFSKSKLQTLLLEKGIKYAHFRELGIPSYVRHKYDDIYELLDYYDDNILPQPACQKAARAVAELCRQYRSTILCFEADPRQCHRSRLAQYVEREFGIPWNFIKYND